ncbi:MAG TPA: class I SAM-dependent methyltransferase [Terriglobia bacterium]|nr:class I SAM-dependent methyltransferase [Terriglobia bacterium]
MLPLRLEEVQLTGVKATLLATLFARALESRSQDSILGDPWAECMVGRVDYEFHKTGIGRNDAVAVAIRAKQLDEWTARFLAQHPCATVVNLGCGLDSRSYRIDAGPDVAWYDVDYPDVIDLRARLFPARTGCTLIAASVMDADWLKTISAHEPVMIVAEGLLYYFPRNDVRRLIQRLTGHFRNGFLAFDTMNQYALQLMRSHPAIVASGVSLQWALEDPHQIESYSPALRCIQALSTSESQHIRKMDFTRRWFYEVYRGIPRISRSSQLMLCEFKAERNPTDESCLHVSDDAELK